MTVFPAKGKDFVSGAFGRATEGDQESSSLTFGPSGRLRRPSPQTPEFVLGCAAPCPMARGEGFYMTAIRWLLPCPLVFCLWGCASAPTAFHADSAANPNAPAAPRFPVATVLAAKDPLSARVCPESGPCVLTNSPPASSTPAESEHHHHHHH